MSFRWQIEIDDITTTTGGPSLPVADWEIPSQAVAENVSETGPPYAVQLTVKLTDPDTGAPLAAPEPNVLIPFTLSGSAGIGQGQDYWFPTNENSATGLPEYDARFIRINGGNTEGAIWVFVNSDALSESDETVTLTMATSSTHNAVTVDLTNATLGTSTVHTLTIVDDDAGGNPQLFFSEPAGTVTETDGSQTYLFDIGLSAPAPAGGVGCDVVQSGGTAVFGTDYTGLPLDGSPPDPVMIGEGLQNRTLAVTVLGDTSVGVDRNLEMGFANVTNATVVTGSGANHDLTIVEDDSTLNDTGEVYFLNPPNDVVLEGQLINLRMHYDGGTPHTPFTVTWTHDGVTDGPSGMSADKGGADRDYATLVQSPTTFGANEEVKTIGVVTIDDVLVEGPEDFRVTLTGVTGPAGVTLGPATTVTVTINDSDEPPPTGGVDGDLTDYQGNRIAPERQPVDFADPHMIVYPAGHPQGGAGEIVQVTATGATILGLSAGNYTPTNESAIHRAVEFAETGWMNLYGGTYASTSQVPIGFELDPIRIQCMTLSWVDQNVYDTYIYANQNNNGKVDTYDWLGGVDDADEASSWVLPGNTVIRDLCFYTERTSPQNPRSATLPRQSLGGGTNGILDNVRFDRITFLSSVSQTDSSVFQIVGTQTGVQPDNTNVPYGRIKFYDCRFGTHPTGFPGARSFRSIRSAMAAWDFRESVPGLWPTFYPSQEYPLYNDCTVGPETYPNLDYRWLTVGDPRGDLPTTGFHIGALAANSYINVRESDRNPPWDPAATNTGPGGEKEGPYSWSGSGMFQLTNRPNYAPDADMSSGIQAFIRVKGGQADLTGDSGGTMLKLWSHNGVTYLKDCECHGHTNFSNGAHGFVSMEQDFSGNSSNGPQGRFRIGNTDTPATDRTYAGGRVIVDGCIASAFSKKTLFKFCGQQHIELRGKVNIAEWSGGRDQLALGDEDLQQGDQFIETLDYSGLLVPSTGAAYNGLLSAYPGWYQGLLSCVDRYHSNWMDTPNNSRNLTVADMDNLATDGPAVYTQSLGIIQQQWNNRLVSTGDGKGTVDPSAGPAPWNGDPTGSAYTGNTQPEKPDVYITPGQNAWVGEDETAAGQAIRTWSVQLSADTDDAGASMCPIRVHRAFTLPPGLSNVVGEDGQQSAWPNPDAAWMPPTGQYLEMRPVGGMANGSNSTAGTAFDSDQVGPNSHHGIWGNKYYPAYFRLKKTNSTAWPAGTHTFVFTLANGGPPKWEYPLGSGVYEDTSQSGLSTLNFGLIPSVDNPEVGLLGGASFQVNLATWGDGDVLSRNIGRDPKANPDASNLTTTLVITENKVGSGSVSYDSGPVFLPLATLFPLDITIPTAGWVAGDSVLLTIDYPNSTNATPPTAGPALQTLLIEFI